MATVHALGEISLHINADISPQPTLMITTSREGDQREGKKKKKERKIKLEEGGEGGGGRGEIKGPGGSSTLSKGQECKWLLAAPSG